VSRRGRFVAGGALVVCVFAFMMYVGVTQSSVYFVTPAELNAAPVTGKAYRVGGMVEAGSLTWNPQALDLRFTLTDGKATVAVRHRGSAPDMFGEGRGAIVEGKWSPEGYFHATQILAKHSEEYKAPEHPNPPGRQP
jgi:cytochrome c-type biogenesis protein CcmE